MKKHPNPETPRTPADQETWRAGAGQPQDEGRRPGSRPAGADRPDRKGQERAAHVDTFQKRRKKPGEAGLANETRPGLGTRGDEGDVKDEEGAPLADEADMRAANAAKTYQPPRPEPQEQGSDSLEQEQERSTGMSGQSSGT